MSATTTSPVSALLAAADGLIQELDQLRCPCTAAGSRTGHRSDCHMPAVQEARARLQLTVETARIETGPIESNTPAAARIDAAAQYLAQNVLRLAWDGLRPDGRCTDGGWPPFRAGRHVNARQEDFRDAACGILRAADVQP